MTKSFAALVNLRCHTRVNSLLKVSTWSYMRSAIMSCGELVSAKVRRTVKHTRLLTNKSYVHISFCGSTRPNISVHIPRHSQNLTYSRPASTLRFESYSDSESIPQTYSAALHGQKTASIALSIPSYINVSSQRRATMQRLVCITPHAPLN